MRKRREGRYGPGLFAGAIALFFSLAMIVSGVLSPACDPPALAWVAFHLMAGHALLLAIAQVLAVPLRTRIELGATLSLCTLLFVPILWNLVVEWPGKGFEHRLSMLTVAVCATMPLLMLADAAWSRSKSIAAATA